MKVYYRISEGSIRGPHLFICGSFTLVDNPSIVDYVCLIYQEPHPQKLLTPCNNAQ